MENPPETHRCWAEIDLSAIRHNVAIARQLSGAQVMAIVKANAYGHGLEAVVRALRNDVTMYGVASLAEAEAVREALGRGKPDVFILGPALPAERARIADAGYIPAISTLDEATAYAALSRGNPIPVHLAIDTGMGRMGIAGEEAQSVAHEIARLPGIEIAGIATHLPVADEDENFTRNQLAGFTRIIDSLRQAGIHAPINHALSSAGIFRFSNYAGAMVRAGLMIYGSTSLPGYQTRLRPALTLKTRITLVRDIPAGHGISYGRTFITPRPMRIATLAIGYADGYQRHLSNKGAEVIINGQRCQVLGRVTMDQIMADVSAIPAAKINDEAILIGKSGNEEILASELSQKSGTIPWEIFTGIGPRVARVYV